MDLLSGRPLHRTWRPVDLVRADALRYDIEGDMMRCSVFGIEAPAN